MKIQIRDTHEVRWLIVEQKETFSDLELKLMECVESRYILKPVTAGCEEGVFRYDISGLESVSDISLSRSKL